MTGVNHHVGLRVNDIEASTGFYISALDARLLTRARRVVPPMATIGMGGTPETEFDFCWLGFEKGGCVELFEFIGEGVPDWVAYGTVRLPHFGVLVDDVAESLRRVEDAGGCALFPEIQIWGPANVMYARDLDDNVFELCDHSSAEIVDILLEMFPECDPIHGARKPRTWFADGR